MTTASSLPRSGLPRPRATRTVGAAVGLGVASIGALIRLRRTLTNSVHAWSLRVHDLESRIDRLSEDSSDLATVLLNQSRARAQHDARTDANLTELTAAVRALELRATDGITGDEDAAPARTPDAPTT